MTMPWPLAEPLLVDRAAHRRDEDMSTAMAVVVREGALLSSDGRLVQVAPHERPEADLTVYLGQDAGRDLVAVVPTQPLRDADDGLGTERMVSLRDLFASFASMGEDGARQREIAATAVAIATWHANHPRCSVCGDPTRPIKGGWVRHCDRDDREHYPRTDPAVIVALTDPEDRLLLAHASYWSPRRFSHLAGYVEPGESLEQAVHREVAEEAGLTVRDLVYEGSQPWPFPASVMVGYRARVDDPTLHLDDDEITEARWVTREELGALVADGHVVLAPRGSIARRLLDQWHGAPVELARTEAGIPVDGVPGVGRS
jgi:NAD+ diphosphatase